MSGVAEQEPPVRFAGYAALFDKVDRGGDVIRRGAFAGALRRLADAGMRVPLLWQHRPDARIGVIEKIAEDARGLRVIGRIEAGANMDAGGEAPAAQIRARKVAGLSFGYRVRAANGDHPRELTELDLVEVSLVTFPMQPEARVHAVE